MKWQCLSSRVWNRTISVMPGKTARFSCFIMEDAATSGLLQLNGPQLRLDNTGSYLTGKVFYWSSTVNTLHRQVIYERGKTRWLCDFAKISSYLPLTFQPKENSQLDGVVPPKDFSTSRNTLSWIVLLKQPTFAVQVENKMADWRMHKRLCDKFRSFWSGRVPPKPTLCQRWYCRKHNGQSW